MGYLILMRPCTGKNNHPPGILPDYFNNQTGRATLPESSMNIDDLAEGFSAFRDECQQKALDFLADALPPGVRLNLKPAEQVTVVPNGWHLEVVAVGGEHFITNDGNKYGFDILGAADVFAIASSVLDVVENSPGHASEDFSDGCFENEDLRFAVFAQCDLACARVIDCDLTGARFDDADITGCTFKQCNLSGASFLDVEGYDTALFADCDLTAAKVRGEFGAAARFVEKNATPDQ